MKFVLVELAEISRKLHLGLRGHILIVEEQHMVLQPRSMNLLNDIGRKAVGIGPHR
jgi:hypothetical protein